MWSAEASWYAPSSRSSISTTPGIYIKEKNDRKPNDLDIRLYLDYGKEQSRRGKYSVGTSWADFWASPSKAPTSDPVPVCCVVEPEETPSNHPQAADKDVGREGEFLFPK